MRNFNRPGVWLGLVAIVLAMSGSAYAASKITGAQIKDGTITSKDIRNGSIEEADLANDASLEGPRGATGPAGPSGPAGPAGAPGAPGAAMGVVLVNSPKISLPPGGYTANGLTATCPAGKVVVGTGYYASVADVGFIESFGTFVGAFVSNSSGITVSDITVQAICATGSGGATASVASLNGSTRETFRAQVSDATAHISCKQAKIGGASKCIARGQFCAIRLQRDYTRYGFTCKKDKAGRYRLT